jgi:hypothetical protein
MLRHMAKHFCQVFDAMPSRQMCFDLIGMVVHVDQRRLDADSGKAIEYMVDHGPEAFLNHVA